ncbi:MAG: NAD(P)/FAD-dependent oxidoreductase [Gammaproteobacteria bacterium]|nr:NAD(P)/FAD-dependent oxidoreductase [Gammaproteobacteria bacterium]
MNEAIHGVAIVGAGFAGLGMAIRLKQAGRSDFVVFERAARVGGTWRDNTYPGCACDVPSHLYSFSFAPNPEWTRSFAPWHEIEAYLERCTDRFDVRSHIRFETEIASARFDEAGALWELTTRGGETVRARALVIGTGPLNKPVVPDLPGLAQYTGHRVHSGQWDHGYEFAGRRVAIVGTGASAIQLVPNLAPKVAKLHVFQRTPAWVLPRLDRRITAFERALYERLPFVQRIVRTFIYWRLEQVAFALLRDGRQRRFLERLAHWYRRRLVKDPALRAALTPGYRLGCKRILIADDYYQAYARPNVELVTAGIAELTAQSIVDEHGVNRPIDALVFATGFAATDFLTPLKIYGRGGRELGQTWKRDVETFLGITCAGFPNFFMLVGPNTGLGHNSIVFMIEAQVRHVLACLDQLESRRARTVEVRANVQHAYSAEIQERMAKTAWSSGCKSWYLSADGRNHTLYPGFTVDYWFRTRGCRARDYEFAT